MIINYNETKEAKQRMKLKSAIRYMVNYELPYDTDLSMKLTQLVEEMDKLDRF